MKLLGLHHIPVLEKRFRVITGIYLAVDQRDHITAFAMVDAPAVGILRNKL